MSGLHFQIVLQNLKDILWEVMDNFIQYNSYYLLQIIFQT